MFERLNILKANRIMYANAAALYAAFDKNDSLRKEVNELSKYYLGRSVNGCKNCFFDAYMELINLTEKKVMEKENCAYELLAGKLLIDVNGDSNKMMSNANITNELAEYHLTSNPSCAKWFQRMPEKPKVEKVKKSEV